MISIYFHCFHRFWNLSKYFHCFQKFWYLRKNFNIFINVEIRKDIFTVSINFGIRENIFTVFVNLIVCTNIFTVSVNARIRKFFSPFPSFLKQSNFVFMVSKIFGNFLICKKIFLRMSGEFELESFVTTVND